MKTKVRSSGSTGIFSEPLFVRFGPLNKGKAHCPASFSENRRKFLGRNRLGQFGRGAGEHPSRNLLSRSELHPRATEEQMTRHPIFLEENKKQLKPEADDQSHKPAKHIEETARLASSVETAKDPGRVRRAKD